ncbi:MAG TPA: protein-tyrosine kinase [Candidatus Eisenbergiella merdipullorum]|uniref:Protein-tyrosine kinase n=1 Tax=Candidatus Eisenbergiella merdipullorum TaxID=2838553 RepID=A0A9D2I3R5_9FIRM|nr:protein-tyrosine kinase [Candidatus Eisenbergiella merdipullorum]
MEEKTIRQNDDVEIDLLGLCLMLLHHLPVILPAALLTALCAFLYTSLLVAPTYQSTTRVYILNRTDSNTITYSDVQLGTQLTSDYSQLIKSRFVLEEVIETMDLPMSYEGLSGMVSVSTPEDTRIIAITVTDTDPVRAMQIANAIREAASEHILNVMDIQAVNVVETANLPSHASGPNTSRNILMGGMLGAALVIGILVVRFLMDDTIKTSEDVEKYLGLSVLAVIPLNEGETDGKKKRRKAKRKAGGR